MTSKAKQANRPPNSQDGKITTHDVLEAFNANDVLDRPGRPPTEEVSPTDDADAPAPG
jgi:hypothetical protein